MKKQTKYNLQLILGFVLAIFGMALLVASFFVPPTGFIHPSVLAAVGESFTFSAGLIGVDYHYSFKKYQHEHHEADENDKE